MSDKVKLPREVVAAIEYFRSIGYMNRAIIDELECESVNSDGRELQKFVNGSDDTFDILLTALVNGYEVEETPEEKIIAYINDLKENGRTFDTHHNQLTGVLRTLALLNIKIEGVNA